MAYTKRLQTKLAPGRAAALCTLLLGGLPAVAEAALLRIDPSASEVRFGPTFVFCTEDASGRVVCPEPRTATYNISGQIRLDTSPFGQPGEIWQRLTLVPVGIESPALDRGFTLYPLTTLLQLGVFGGELGPCDIPTGTDMFCSGTIRWSPWTWTAGTWNGRSLMWIGSRETDSGVFGYTITATIASVPEPGTLLLSLPLLGLIGTRQMRARSHRKQDA